MQSVSVVSASDLAMTQAREVQSDWFDMLLVERWVDNLLTVLRLLRTDRKAKPKSKKGALEPLV